MTLSISGRARPVSFFHAAQYRSTLFFAEKPTCPLWLLFAIKALFCIPLLGVTGLSLITLTPPAYSQGLAISPPLRQIDLQIEQATVKAEVADTEGSRSLGLMYRQHLPAEAGMLFVFEQPKKPCFWMKNTYIPLSIAFITETGRISSILPMQPERTDPHCPIEPIRFALEVNQGWFAQHNIQVGAKVIGLPN